MASGSSWPAAVSGGVVRSATGAPWSVRWTRGQQQDLEPLAFSTQSRNDTRKTRVCAVRVALVPAETSALDAPACTPGTEGVVSGPGRWFWIPNDGSTAVDGSEAVPSSCGFRGGSRKEDNAITGGSYEDVVSAVYYLIASH